MDTPTPVAPSRVAQLAAELSRPTPIRRGSLYERKMKCGQPACPCQHDPKAAHGPYFTLTQKVGGKTRSRYVAAQQFVTLRQQIEAGQQFRKRVEQYWEACEQWADQELQQPASAAAEAAEKKSFVRRSGRKSSKRSRRS